MSDEALIVRGGVLAGIPQVVESFVSCEARWGFYAISVFGADGLSMKQVIARNPNLQDYRKVRISTAGRIRSAGFSVVPTFDPDHQSIKFPVCPSDMQVEDLVSVFDPPVANPIRQG